MRLANASALPRYAEQTTSKVRSGPTSALSAPEVEILFRVIADLKSKGVAIVYISHRLEELIRIGDFITVLRDGRVTGRQALKDVDVHWIVRQMIGSDAKDFSTPGDHQFGVCVSGSCHSYQPCPGGREEGSARAGLADGDRPAPRHRCHFGS